MCFDLMLYTFFPFKKFKITFVFIVRDWGSFVYSRYLYPLVRSLIITSGDHCTSLVLGDGFWAEGHPEVRIPLGHLHSSIPIFSSCPHALVGYGTLLCCSFRFLVGLFASSPVIPASKTFVTPVINFRQCFIVRVYYALRNS